MCGRRVIKGVEIAWCAIAADGRSRHERESEAVDGLIKLLYGPGAVKKNLPSGAPCVYVDGGPALPCSISHCASLAIVAKAPFVTGIDIETERQQLGRVAARFVNPGEESLGLLKVWTLKEAVYKAAGKPGLALRDIHLLPSPCLADGTPFDILFSDYLTAEVFLSLVRAR